MYDTLLELPLFRGVSRERISEIAGKAKFHFLKFMPDAEIITPGDAGTHLRFLVSGAVRMSLTAPENGISISQTLYGPDMLLPDFLFGRNTVYPCLVKAISNVSMLQVAKSDYLNILAADPIFMLNYLNYLAMNAQKAVDGTLSVMSGQLKRRIAFRIVALSQQSGKSIVLKGGKVSLAASFGVTRNTLAETLREMNEAGLVQYDPSLDEIQVLYRRGLTSLLY